MKLWALGVLGATIGCTTYVAPGACDSDEQCATGERCAASGACVPAGELPDAGATSDLTVEFDGSAVVGESSFELRVALDGADGLMRVELGACAVDLEQPRDSKICAGIETVEPATNVVISGLNSGTAYLVEPFVEKADTRVVGETRELTTLPGRVEALQASDGTSRNGVELVWPAVRGATSYSIYRDGALLAQPIIPGYTDTTATRGGMPAAPTEFVASAGTRADGIALSWVAPQVEAGAPHVYRIAAIGVAGEGEVSAEETGFRAADPVDGYVLSTSLGRRYVIAPQNGYFDTEPEPGTWTFDYLNVTRGNRPGTIQVEFNEQLSAPGPVVDYELAARNAVGEGPAATVSGSRGAPELRVQWWVRWSPMLESEPVLVGTNEDGWEFESPAGLVVSIDANVFEGDSATLRQYSARGWAAECDADDDCTDGDDCTAGLCAPTGYCRVPRHAHHLGRDTNSEPGRQVNEIELGAFFYDDRLVGRHEVRQDDWERVMGSNPSRFTGCGGDCPVENVTWGSALAYANALSVLDGLTPCYDLSTCTGDAAAGSLVCEVNPALTGGITSVYDCEGWRLPTEFEWEWAARSLELRSRTSWLPAPGATRCTDDPLDHALFARTCSVAEVDWPGCDTTVSNVTCAGPAPVGGLAASPWGLHDVVGNVAEFTWGRLGTIPFMYENVDEPEILTAAGAVMVRGGSYRDPPSGARLSSRASVAPGYRGGEIGFRVIRTLPSEDD